MQATLTNAFWDERKLNNFPCPAVALVRGLTQTRRPDGVACIAEVVACIQIKKVVV